MQNDFQYSSAREYAMWLGLKASCIWIVSFLVTVYSFPSLLGRLAYLCGLYSIYFIGIRLRRFRLLFPQVTMLQIWSLSWMVFAGCVLLTTFVQYIVFRWFDGGCIWSEILKILDSHEMVESYKQMNASDLLLQMKQMIQDMNEIPIKDLVLSFLSTNMIIGFIFSLISILFCIGIKKKE